MQAVGEKQERHALHMVHVGPCNLKIHWQWRQGVGDLLWKDASVANSRMPIRLLGHNEWIQRSRTGFSLSLFLSISPPVIPLLLLLISPYAWSREVGKSWSSLCMNNTGIKFPCNDFFPPSGQSSAAWKASSSPLPPPPAAAAAMQVGWREHGPYLGLKRCKRWCSYAWKVQLRLKSKGKWQ